MNIDVESDAAQAASFFLLGHLNSYQNIILGHFTKFELFYYILSGLIYNNS